MNIVDITGQTFGRLTVLRRSERKSNAGALWDCACACGGATVAGSLKLRSGLTKSCGCWKQEVFRHETHGLSKAHSRTYKSWREMRNRCNNSNSSQWQWYGGRGIKIAGRWSDFSAFLADMGERPEGMTLDRLDSDGNYGPGNCRWATPKQQAETNRGTFKKGALRTFEKTKHVAR